MVPKTDHKEEIEAWSKKNKIEKLKPGKARYAKDPGLSCAWNTKNMKPGTAEQIEKRKQSAAAWKIKKAAWKKKMKAQRKKERGMKDRHEKRKN